MMEASELDTSKIELRKRGQLTLPKSLRDALHLEPGDALRKQMRKLMKQHGVNAEELLRDL
jgi:bifunctional DNA-binding transcriptional regulator/antitoxin component of YhaV-PrlF toxin-antitoxin module